MAAGVAEIAKQLSESGIVAAGTLENFIPPKANPESVETLVSRLIESKHLTPFQAANVKAGKAKALVLGNYTILDKIGAGGMGQVFKAAHRRMERIVALKTLPQAMVKNPLALARFQREVKAASKLEHPNIVSAYDADQVGNVHFLVMQYVDGRDLSATVKADGPLPVAKAVACVLQAAQGLAYAHSKGVIHRDIKPANLLVGSDGNVKILDMGLARVEQDDAAAQSELTGTGTVMGTVDYMSPEQGLSTKDADARADVYSLGCTLHYLLTGRPPFEGDTVAAKLLAHHNQQIPDMRRSHPEVPATVQGIFERMVAKKPGDRYQTMRGVVEALEGVQAALSGRKAATVRKPEAGVKPAVMSEKTRSLLAKIVGGAFATIIAPISVAFLIEYLKSDDKPTRPEPTAVATLTPKPFEPGPTDSPKPAATVESNEPTASVTPPTAKPAAPSVPVTPPPPPAPAGWEPAPALSKLPGIVTNPTVLPGIEQWQVMYRLPATRITSLDFSTQGRLAVASADGFVRIYEAAGMRLERVMGPFAGHPGWVDGSIAIAYSPDGQWLLIDSADGVRFWHRVTDRMSPALPVSNEASDAKVAWHPAGGMAAIVKKHEVFLCAVPKDEGMPNVVARWNGKDYENTDFIQDISWSPDGTRLACAGDPKWKIRGVVLLDQDARLLGKLPESTDPTVAPGSNLSVAWSPDGTRIAMGDMSGDVRIFPVDGGEPETIPAAFGVQACPLRWHPDADRLLCGFHDALSLVKTRDLQQKPKKIPGWPFQFGAGGFNKTLAVSPDGTMFAVGAKDRLRIVRFDDLTTDVYATPHSFKGFRWHLRQYNRDQWSADGRLFVTEGYDNNPYRVLSAAGAVVGKAENRMRGVPRFYPHPTRGNLVAVCDEAMTMVIDGARLTSLPLPAGKLTAAAWVPDGERLAVACSGEAIVRVFDEHWLQTKSIALPESPLAARWFAFAASGTPTDWLIGAAVGKDLVPTLFQIDATGTVTNTKTIDPAVKKCREIVFDPGGTWVAMTSGSSIVASRLADGASRKFTRHKADIAGIDWSKHGPEIISAGYDSRSFVWNPRTDQARSFDRSNVNESFTSAAVDPVTGLVAVKTADDITHCFDPETLAVHWSFIPLPEDAFATFSAGGALLHGDAAAVEMHLAYVVDRADGRREILSHGQFVDLVAAARKTAADEATGR